MIAKGLESPFEERRKRWDEMRKEKFRAAEGHDAGQRRRLVRAARRRAARARHPGRPEGLVLLGAARHPARGLADRGLRAGPLAGRLDHPRGRPVRRHPEARHDRAGDRCRSPRCQGRRGREVRPDRAGRHPRALRRGVLPVQVDVQAPEEGARRVPDRPGAAGEAGRAGRPADGRPAQADRAAGTSRPRRRPRSDARRSARTIACALRRDRRAQLVRREHLDVGAELHAARAARAAPTRSARWSSPSRPSSGRLHGRVPGPRGEPSRSGTAAAVRPARAGSWRCRGTGAARSRAGSSRQCCCRSKPSRTVERLVERGDRPHPREPVRARAAVVAGHAGDEVPDAGLEHEAERFEHALDDVAVGPLVAHLDAALVPDRVGDRRPGTAARRRRAPSPGASRWNRSRIRSARSRSSGGSAASSLSWVVASTPPRPRSAAAPGSPARNSASASSGGQPGQLGAIAVEQLEPAGPAAGGVDRDAGRRRAPRCRDRRCAATPRARRRAPAR